MFGAHYLDDPVSGDTQTLDGWSYVWAGLLGPAYVVLKGFPLRGLAMAGISLAIAATLAALSALFALFWNDNDATTITVVMLFIIAFATQGVVSVEMVRRGFVGRGYREGYY